jgi:hypothetical protein
MVQRISFALFGLVCLGSCGGTDHPSEPELGQSEIAPPAPVEILSTGDTGEGGLDELGGEPAEYD